MKTQLTGLFLSRLRNRIGVESCGPRLHLINLIFKFFFSFLLRWSHDGKFFARMTSDTLSIYETPVSSCLFCIIMRVKSICVSIKMLLT